MASLSPTVVRTPLVMEEKKSLHAGEGTSQEVTSEDTGINSQGTKYRTCKELLQSVSRLDEEPKKFCVAVADMTELEQELHDALMRIRSRKTQLAMEYVSSLRERVRKLTEENEELKNQVALAKQREYDADDEDDGGVCN